MITIFASLVGFISSIVPEILKLFRDQKEKKHQLEILDRQLNSERFSAKKVYQEMEAARQLSEQSTLYSTFKSGVSWVDALNGTVRPVLAYFFFMIYASIKFMQYQALTFNPFDIENIEIMWNTDDQAIFAGIISFYFGQRTFSKFKKSK